MPDIKLPVIKPLSSRTDAEKAAAREDDRATHKILRSLARSERAGNKGCADCTSRSSGWGVLPHGVFVCIHCAQLHRHIGRHISQTKAFNTGTYLWYKDEVSAMRTMGNARANAVYASKAKGAPRRPDENAPRDEKLAYVRSKYEKRRWFDADAADPLAAASADSVAEPKQQAQKQAPKQKPKPAKFNTRAGRRRVHSRSLLGTNKAPDDGWAEWGTTASDAYDSAHEAHQAAASPPRARAKAKKSGDAKKDTPEETEVDLLDFNNKLTISVPSDPAAAAAGPEKQPGDEGQEGSGTPSDGQLHSDYAQKQAYVLSVMRQTGPMVHSGGVADAHEKAQACRLFGPPMTTRSHVAPPYKVGSTGFFESFGLAS